MNKSILTIAILLSGCANMSHGNTQAISINSFPDGANVYEEPEKMVGITPTKLILARRDQHVIQITKEGFKSQSIAINNHSTGEVWKNIVWVHPIGWIIGGTIDLSTGANKELDITDINVKLVPITLK